MVLYKEKSTGYANSQPWAVGFVLAVKMREKWPVGVVVAIWRCWVLATLDRLDGVILPQC